MILALQCCPLDSAQALELTRLICDIEPQPSPHEYCIAARKDTPEDHVAAMVRLATVKFAHVHVIRGQRLGVGWPEGPNDLWAETMMRLSLARKQQKTQQDAALTFEADCVPLRADWLDVLHAAWQQTDARKLDVVGHAHGEPTPDHINGNAIFRIGLLRRYPQLNNANTRKGWDHYHGELLLKLGWDTDAIFQVYNLRDYDRGYLEAVRKNGTIPALFHGAKGMAAIRAVRGMFEDGTLAKRIGQPYGALRAYAYVKRVKNEEAPAAEIPAAEEVPENSGSQ